MKTKSIGIVLIIIGIIMTIYTGFNYVTTEKLVEIGPIKINQEVNHPVQWTPIIGLIIIAGGIILVARSTGKKA
ncbi:hypothetical protein [Flavobacterium sp. K5-23]|uniref:hypothetical protein n=1 Tax=Flavobacterium sp. K5-23 TaxID=2746225 RepID=UPI00200BFFEE|nr:hypothetical protein [Flavobacterium sp. K5-23]UQD56678.1 hypothetical protein FLAK523_09875 [Flavobacterium sp. K5-23]